MSTDIAVKLNKCVEVALNSNQSQGFEKALALANSMKELKGLLSKEVMEPFMQLQGHKIGFVTDKDRENGYPIDAVRNCLIEAVLKGVQPFGNHFNIIAGNCYITKEGFKYLLDNVKGLVYQTIAQLPRIQADKGSAAIVMKIEWTMNGESNSQELDIPVKVNKFMGADAVIGKAERKARAWLYNNLTGIEITDGDAIDTTFEEIADKSTKMDKKTSKAENSLLEAITPKTEPKSDFE